MLPSGWPAAPRTPGTLSGVRILDLSRILAGPYAAMLLGDLGADVIKVEHPDGDDTRRWGPPFVGKTAAYFLAANRNKRAILADFLEPADNALVTYLADHADVVVENFRPGSLRNVGLDYESLRERNPGLIYCTITGFASDSKDGGRPGFDLVVQAMGGIMSVTGETDRDPVKVGVPISDLVAGMHATVAVLAALYEREQTGRGTHIEVPLLDATVASLVNQSMNWLVGNQQSGPMGSDHPTVVPYRGFRTASGDMVVAVGSDRQFAALCAVVGRPEWISDARTATNDARRENREWLTGELEAILAKGSRDEWLERMAASGVPCGPIRTVSEVFSEGDVTERMVRQIESPVLGALPQVLSPFLLDGKHAPIDLAPPGLGEHDLAIRRAVGAEVM
jgi:crotonobetainyl-CoA:carnitine CoA-transferase CaiB-like acyl-CoA transferase